MFSLVAEPAMQMAACLSSPYALSHGICPPKSTRSKSVSRRPPALPWPLRAGAPAVSGAQRGLPCSPAGSSDQAGFAALV